MKAQHLTLAIIEGLPTLQYVLDGKQHTLQFPGAPELRQVAVGLNRMADILDPTRKLYAVCYEIVDMKQGGWVPGGIIHLHASNEAEARAEFFKARTQKLQVRIVACAPVVQSNVAADAPKDANGIQLILS
jgi:hypothetical protein